MHHPGSIEHCSRRPAQEYDGDDAEPILNVKMVIDDNAPDGL